MDKQEISEEVDRSFDHSLVKAFPAANLLTIAIALLAVAVAWGSTRADIQSLQRDMISLQDREMTPGAAAALAGVRAQDESQDQQILALRADLRDSRREILDELKLIRLEIQEHEKNTRAR